MEDNRKIKSVILEIINEKGVDRRHHWMMQTRPVQFDYHWTTPRIVEKMKFWIGHLRAFSRYPCIRLKHYISIRLTLTTKLTLTIRLRLFISTTLSVCQAQAEVMWRMFDSRPPENVLRFVSHYVSVASGPTSGPRLEISGFGRLK